MTSFDLDSLLRFQPPEYLCQRCYGIMATTPDVSAGRCPVCNAVYIPTHEFPACADYLKWKGLAIRFDNLTAHGTQLATIAHATRQTLDRPNDDYPPMRALLHALNTAQQFVHFTTYGISAMLLGAIKITAQRIPVRGLVSGVRSDAMMRELTEYPNEAPNLDLRIFRSDASKSWFPHQKMIVIDGLIAFKGSANLTDFGWRKAAQGGEVIEVVTDLREIAELHNRYFSASWAAFAESTANDRIMMSTF